MEVVTFAAAPTYTAAGHDEIVARRLQGGAASSAQFALVGHSTFPAGSSVAMDGGGPIDKIYIVVEGTLTIVASDGQQHDLGVGDSILIVAGEARAVENRSDRTSGMIVITPPTGQR